MRSQERASRAAFLPTAPDDLRRRGWDGLDILIVTGDAYVDHPSFGAAMIGRVLEAAGYRVGIVAQPDWRDPAALQVMGRPRLFVGVTAGNLDSMLAHHTAARHRRRDDAYTAGGKAGRRPDLATVVYAQLARQAFPGLPVVIGGIETSLRRIAHLDYWQDKIRPSILLDAKAELLVYGMGEAPVLEVAARLSCGRCDLTGIRGTAHFVPVRDCPAASEVVELPSCDDCQASPVALLEATRLVEAEQNPWSGRPLLQRHGARPLIVQPPGLPPAPAALDRLYALPFARLPHPDYGEPIPAFATIRDSITVVRGCAGGCSFCGLGFHQGKFLSSRSLESVLEELRRHAAQPGFRGTISDLGGPSANLYGCANGLAEACRTCRRASCLSPAICKHFKIDGEPGVRLLRAVRQVPGIRHAFVASGIRMDVALRTPEYLRELVRHHVSGHLKVAPEHLHPDVLRRMRKPAGAAFADFLDRFDRESRAAGKEQYLVPYFMSNFPGCTDREMAAVEAFLGKRQWNLQQVQDFIPLPMTPAAAMYWSGLDYETGEPIVVNRGTASRQRQQQQLRQPRKPSRK